MPLQITANIFCRKLTKQLGPLKSPVLKDLMISLSALYMGQAPFISLHLKLTRAPGKNWQLIVYSPLNDSPTLEFQSEWFLRFPHLSDLLNMTFIIHLAFSSCCLLEHNLLHPDMTCHELLNYILFGNGRHLTHSLDHNRNWPFRNALVNENLHRVHLYLDIYFLYLSTTYLYVQTT